jgi:putative flippase GtrA
MIAPTLFRRYVVFNLVGGLGIAVQLALLHVFTAGLGLNYLLATGLAVEAAVLHNFFWHEGGTWRDRARLDRAGRWTRLLRFQISNGAISVCGNVMLMQLLVGTWGVNYTLANLASITACSIVNFLAGDRFVFPETRRA